MERSKKVGSLLDYDKDIERKKKKQLAIVALNKLNNVWIKGNKLKTSSLVNSWALILTAGERFNAYEYYRKQLKKILNIRYPPPKKKKKKKNNNKTKQKNPENNNKKTKTKQNNKQTKK